ncbi:MAG: hypothetical protein HYZ40_00500 [Rhodospirillales bacterium]|nr:hypothetical protein [Rhodospirillales bacterium]
MIARLLCLVLLLLLPRIALAQESWKPPGACALRNWNDVETWREWNSHTPPDNATRWAEEKSRYTNNRDVWRWLDRLYIAVAGGKVLTLSDCAFGDDLHFYLYERFDEAGSFHVVRVYFYEDHLYALVMRATGKVVAIPGLPIWSPDRTRFAYGVCDQMNAKDDVAIMRVTADGLSTETAGHMPCGLGDCKLIWEGNASLSATCQETAEQGSKRQVMRFTRRGDGWATTTSNR